MSTLEPIKQKVSDLLKKAEELDVLAENFQKDLSGKKDLVIEYQKWYRTAHSLLKENNFSGLEEFEKAYDPDNRIGYFIYQFDPKHTDYGDPQYIRHFKIPFDQQISLLAALPDELETKQYLFMKELSSGLSLSELEQAQILLNIGFERAAGMVARVALEGFIRTMYQTIFPASAVPKFDQCIIELKNRGLIEERHRKHLAELYGLGNECAHPGSTVTKRRNSKDDKR